MDCTLYAEDGCFVYQVIGEPIEGRFKPSDGDSSRTGQLYSPGDMVTMDRVLCSTSSDGGGPYLRLADGTGWLFERKLLEQTMQRMSVQCGLWSFYVGNYPEGQILLRHPTDRADMCVFSHGKKTVIYESLQKIYCDRKVQNPHSGVNFYRVQGTNGWMPDRRPGAARKEDSLILIDEHAVKTGLFAFQALMEVGVRGLPKLGDETQTGRMLRRGEVCIADAIYDPPYLSSRDGPFIHLTDGSGWLLEKENTIRLLQSLSVKTGAWTVTILNPPHGISLYRQPVSHHSQEPPEEQDQRQDTAVGDASANYWVTLTENEVRISLPSNSLASRLNDMRYNNTHYDPGTSLECDRMLEYGAVHYYRVKGTKGWIFDRTSSGERVARVVQTESLKPSKPMSTDAGSGWTVEFVRGAAAVVHGLQELAHNEKQEAITFRTTRGIRLHVYYASRTVGVAMDDPELGKTQLFCRDCSNEELGQIFLEPPLTAQSHRRFSRRRNNDQLVGHGPNEINGGDSFTEEEGYRNELLDVEREMNRIREKEHELLRKLKEFDERRTHEAMRQRRERKQRDEELEKAHKEINLLVREKVKEIAQRQEIERVHKEAEADRQERERMAKLQMTCLECYKTFRSKKERDEHCKYKHGLCCDHCRKIFQSSQALDEHIIRKGHY